LLTGLVIGLGGVFGYLSNLVELLPLSVLAPILVFVAIGITVQAFEATPVRYAAAVVFSFFPAIARMVTIKLSDPTYVPSDRYSALFAEHSHGISELAVITVLGNGFIITSMIWASFLVALIDGRTLRAAGILLIGGALSLFGIIHSVQISGGVYLPWSLDDPSRQLVWQFAGAYAVLAIVLSLLSLAAPRERRASA
jgi:AGZA family xanthine/uracil permease-like MFS transporter